MPPGFSFRHALAWTAIVTSGLWLGLSVVILAFPRGGKDIVWLGLTQVVVYALVLGAFAFAQAERFERVVCARRAAAVVCLGSLGLGAALQVPATLISDIVDHFFPLPPSLLAERLTRITPHSLAHGVAIFLVVAGAGPLVEELFFRGALFGALRRGESAFTTVCITALCFALGHLDTHLLLPLFATAVVIGYVREWSGSIWPGVLLHAAFNGITLALAFHGELPGGHPRNLPIFGAISGCFLSFALLALLRRFALARAVNRG